LLLTGSHKSFLEGLCTCQKDIMQFQRGHFAEKFVFVTDGREFLGRGHENRERLPPRVWRGGGGSVYRLTGTDLSFIRMITKTEEDS
jgi:hypothetical protein